ncbi:hypothetical protein CONLIGDRAFT_692138 [Coniochaeta ligniaria NRRL 30616]|uniref:Dynamin N-terminal domain-containing protein n=1 Tax=Coniochaeta ligniaria NRRL 30616 TaxID=1408157 RepID=A0A1J7IU83_9PEZI|nr:hypothetical protein CONLIGDRAFT_692138 [Coniochaeta ligniaria NRRL 30616]
MPLDDLKKQNSEFRVFIGFAGVTGAGKTSAINSIIGFIDLLPSSNEAAATAVPCLIAYNDDPDLDARFRAEVTFKSEHDVRQELDEYFDALTILEEIRKGSQSEDSEANEAIQPDNASESAAKARHALKTDRLKDLDTVEEDNQDLLDMVSAVFGLDETELKAETTDSLLAKHPDVHNLLGQMIPVVGSDVNEFSDRIKPYMDSVPAAHGPSGVEFAAWPLINEVKVFVRSPVLKNGIVLVDLPGLADNVESRASVAQNYFSKLSVTAIVAPIIRARNEQTAVNLMTENQQFCMQMDGKFHKKSFCVILSKMDDINVETYLKQHAAEAKLNQALQSSRDTLKTVNQEFKEIEREKSNQKQLLKSINQQVSKLQADQDTTTTKADEIAECNKRRLEAQAKSIDIDRRLHSNRKQAKHLNGRILHWCIHGRNALVKKEIQMDFQRRQKRLATASQRQDVYDGTVMTFPISSSAYWKVIEDSEPPVGFPADVYTGIPALQSWLRHSAIPDREKHLDMALNALHGLFNTMQIWSEFQGQLNLTKQFVNDEVLHRPLHTLDMTLNKTFNKLSRDIRTLNPMKNKDSTVANCKARCIAVVKRWSSKEPDNLLCTKKMFWNTYNACVNRRGAVYRAKSQGKHRYAWIETLCNLFYEGIVKDWNLALNEQIPALRAPINKEIDNIWATLMAQLGKRVRIAAPQMQPVLAKERDRLDQIKDQLKDMVGKQFDDISVGASKAHRTITNSVRDKFEVAFRKAKKEKGLYYPGLQASTQLTD